MTITQLEYIIAVDTFRHFKTAADKCFVTQPTLSMQIQKLEEELGITVFDRSKKPVIPTVTGALIILQARKVINSISGIREIVDNEKNMITGELRIGVIPTIAPYLMPLFITDFIEKYPLLNISIEEQLTEQIIRNLKQGLLDVGLVVTPTQEQGMVEIPIFYEPFVVFTGKKHRLQKKAKIDQNDIDPREIWLLNEGHCFRSQMINLCGGDIKNGQNLHYQSGSFETLIKIVEKQSGYTLLPELAVLDMSEDRKKRVRLFSEPVPVREVSLITHRSNSKKRVIDCLKKEILMQIPENFKSKKGGQVVAWRS